MHRHTHMYLQVLYNIERYCFEDSQLVSHLRGRFLSIISFFAGKSWLFSFLNSATDDQSAYLHLIRELLYSLLMKEDFIIENDFFLLETNPLMLTWWVRFGKSPILGFGILEGLRSLIY